MISQKNLTINYSTKNLTSLMGRILKVTETIDHETGETYTTSNEYTVDAKTPKYIMVLTDNLPYLLQNLNGSELKVLLVLESVAGYNENKVNLSAALRQELATKVGTTSSAFNNVISSLKKKRFIIAEGGSIKIEPKYLWRGETKYLKKRITFSG